MRLALDLAERMTRAACDAAQAQECLVSAAVVDAGGHLVSFRRMDKAEFAGATIAGTVPMPGPQPVSTSMRLSPRLRRYALTGRKSGSPALAPVRRSASARGNSMKASRVAGSGPSLSAVISMSPI